MRIYDIYFDMNMDIGKQHRFQDALGFQNFRKIVWETNDKRFGH